MKSSQFSTIVLASLFLFGCGGSSGHSSADPITEPPVDAKVVAVAGDIGSANENDSATAALVTADTNIDLVLTTGDNAYEEGTASEFKEYYDSAWGAFKNMTRPAPGNHDYNTQDADAYFKYFGAQAGPAGLGYYSFDHGGWHFISLNSEIDSKEQLDWLRRDLATVAPGVGIIAFWHHPLYNSGTVHGEEDGTKSRRFWQILEEYRADIILNGHEHSYQRYRKQDSNGDVPPWGGIRQFIVGTGGVSLSPIGTPKDHGFEFGSDQHFGILKLSLMPDAYWWRFVSIDGATIDSGGPVRINRTSG